MRGTRPMSVHKTPLETALLLNRTTYLGFDTVRRWRWICHICNLECNPPMAAQPEAYAAALEHLEDEHLAIPADAYDKAIDEYLAVTR